MPLAYFMALGLIFVYVAGGGLVNEMTIKLSARRSQLIRQRHFMRRVTVTIVTIVLLAAITSTWIAHVLAIEQGAGLIYSHVIPVVMLAASLVLWPIKRIWRADQYGYMDPLRWMTVMAWLSAFAGLALIIMVG